MPHPQLPPLICQSRASLWGSSNQNELTGSSTRPKKWWLEVHVPRVMKWPGLVGYDVNFALNENEPFDGVGIVCFDNKEAAEKVFQTLEGSSARSAAIAESSRNAIFLAEEVVIVPREKAHQG
jgi:hypothetical protein